MNASSRYTLGLVIALGMPTDKGFSRNCVAKDPVDKAGKRHGVVIYCYGNEGWEETTYSHGVEEGPKRKFYGPGKKQEERTYKAGIDDGPYKKWYDNGKLEEEGTTRNWKQHGLIKKYEDDGNIESEATYMDGKKHGPAKKYDHEGGKLSSEESWQNDKKHGVFTEYYENGKKRRVTNYANDDENGDAWSFTENGNIESWAQFKAGKRDGWHLQWHDNSDGHYLYSATFEIQGQSKFYVTHHSNGNVQESTCYDREGRAIRGLDSCRAEIQALPGILAKAATFPGAPKTKKNGTNQNNVTGGALDPDSETEYYADGKPRKKCQTKDGKLHGTCKAFFSNGRAEVASEYRHGVMVGKQSKWFENGKLKQEEIRDNAGNLQSRKEYYESGEIHKESQFKEKREVSAREFYMNGAPKLEYRWNENKQTIVEYHDNGKVSMKGTLVPVTDCYYSCWQTMRYTGLKEDFYENGKPFAKVNYIDGGRDGRAEVWWPNGKIRHRKLFKNDKLVEAKEWDDDGKLLLDEKYFPDGSRKKMK